MHTQNNQHTAATAPTDTITIAGHRIAYRKIGSGAPLLLANRMRGTLDTWDPLFLDSLALEHTVITFDYPGVGYSSGKLPLAVEEVSSLVIALAAALGYEQFAIGGWSWGGIVAQALVTDHPGHVTHAIVIGSNPPGEIQVPIQQAFIEKALTPVNDLADEEVLFFVPGSAASRAAARASHERIYARPGVAELIPSTMPEFMAYFQSLEVFQGDGTNRRAALAASGKPVLILCGDQDISAAAANWYPLLGRFPSAQFVVLGDAGHAPQHQYPQLAARYIAQFAR